MDYKELSPSPVANAIVEIRIEANKNPSDILFDFLSEFKEEYPEFVQNNSTEPGTVNPNVHAREYTIFNEYYKLSIGKRSVSVEINKEYKLWNNFFNVIISLIDFLEKQEYIKHLLRIGVRYIDFFKDQKANEIFKTLPSLEMPESFKRNYAFHESRFYCDDKEAMVRIYSQTHYQDEEMITTGPGLDIDTWKDFKNVEFINSQVKNEIESLHSLNKIIFENCMNEEFIASIIKN